MSRGNERSAFDVHTRVRLLETDIDHLESTLERHIRENADRLDQLVRETHQQTEALRASISQNARMGVGILCAIVSGAILFAIQLAFR